MFSNFGLDNFSQMSEKSGEYPFLRRTTRLSHVTWKSPRKWQELTPKAAAKSFCYTAALPLYSGLNTHTLQIEASAIATRITLLEQKRWLHLPDVKKLTKKVENTYESLTFSLQNRPREWSAKDALHDWEARLLYSFPWKA